MKKTLVAAIAILAAFLIVLAAAVALLQYSLSPTSAGSGKLAVMGTDPPVHSEEVRNATAHYNSVQAHKSGSDMSSGWVQVQGSGTLNLFASGSAQTMAVAQVDSGTYDAFRFNVDSVQVNYMGEMYAATVASTTLTAQSTSRVLVNGTTQSTAIMDIRSLIVNTGTSTSPQLVFSASAIATSVPPQSFPSLTLQIGTNVNLSGEAWWSSFVAQTSSNVNAQATLSSSSLSVNLQNSGSANGEVQEVIVTPMSASALATLTLPSSLNGSAVFTVSGAGAVQQSSSLQASALLNGGTTVSSGSSSTINYNGNISIQSTVNGAKVSGIVTGQQYIVTCIGANTYASTTVVAT